MSSQALINEMIRLHSRHSLYISEAAGKALPGSRTRCGIEYLHREGLIPQFTHNLNLDPPSPSFLITGVGSN